MSETTLDVLEPGSKAKVIRVKGKGATRKRILDMGIVPGVEIEIIKRAPLKDPVEFKVKGYNLSMRQREAGLVVVQPLEV